MNIRSIHELQDYIDEEFSWRLKEISDLKNTVQVAEPLREDTLIRASVPLLYAHWEGFIKSSSEAYLNYIGNKNLKYNELKPCFVVHGFKKRIHEISNSNQTKKNIEITKFILDELDQKATLSYKGLIDTKSNLNSKVFENIASSIGIDTNNYETKYNLIDESLLKRRNKIAHGNYVDLMANDLINLCDKVISLLRQYKTDIENSSALRDYKK